MHGGDKDHAMGVSSLTNEEPLMVVKARINIVWEVVRENCGNGRGSVVWKGKVPLRRGGCGSVFKRTFCAEDGDCYDLFPFLLIYFLFCLSLCTAPCLALFAFLCACLIAYLCVVLGHILHDT